MRIEFPGFECLTDFPAAVEVLNRFYWNVTVEGPDSDVWLRSGERLVARFESFSELETFAAGMALALGVLPGEVGALLDTLMGE